MRRGKRNKPRKLREVYRWLQFKDPLLQCYFSEHYLLKFCRWQLFWSDLWCLSCHQPRICLSCSLKKGKRSNSNIYRHPHYFNSSRLNLLWECIKHLRWFPDLHNSYGVILLQPQCFHINFASLKTPLILQFYLKKFVTLKNKSAFLKYTMKKPAQFCLQYVKI